MACNIPIPVQFPKFIPIPSYSNSRLTNERHLSLNNQTMISVQTASTQLSWGRNLNSVSVSVILSSTYNILLLRNSKLHTLSGARFASSRPMRILAHIKSSHSHSHFGIFVGFPRKLESHSHAQLYDD